MTTEIKGATYVRLAGAATAPARATDTDALDEQSDEEEGGVPPAVEQEFGAHAQTEQRIFISHGKNHKILDAIKEIVVFGKFVPVVSIEMETPSKPVPDKVMDDMRSCSGAVIHVATDETIVGKTTSPGGRSTTMC